MTRDQFALILSSMAAVAAAALYLYAYSLAGEVGRRRMLFGGPYVVAAVLNAGWDVWYELRMLFHRGRHAGTPTVLLPVVMPALAEEVHEDVTEASPPLAAVFAPEMPVLQHVEPDSIERQILQKFDALIRETRIAEPWELAWQKRVDKGLAAVGLDGEAHRRWRQAAWDMSTGSYPVLDRELVAA